MVQNRRAKEGRIKDKVKRALDELVGVEVWSAPTGMFMGYRFGRNGQADYTGIILGSGRRIEIEVKTKEGVLSKDQEEFRDMIVGAGGWYVVVTDPEEAVRKVEEVIERDAAEKDRWY
jgi:hypothetical protein